MKSFKRSIRSFILILIGLEIMLRVLGYSTYRDIEAQEVSVPSNYGTYHPKYGFTVIPGVYKVTIEDSLTYNVTHNSDSTRLTKIISISDSLPKVFFFGCSFTWGAGIDDTNTYPYLVQKAIPRYNIRNYASIAGGTIQTYLKLKDLINAGEMPKSIFVAYASFHNQRNTMSSVWATMIREASESNYLYAHKRKQAKGFWDDKKFPYAFMNDKQLNIGYKLLPMHPKICEYSSICNILYSFYLMMDTKCNKEELVTRAIMQQIILLCKNHNIKLVVACITHDEITASMQRYLDEMGVENFNFNVDYTDNKYNLMPYDAHPNALAHKIYADSVINHIY